MTMKSEIKLTGILILAAMVVIVLVFALPHAPQVSLFELPAAWGPSSELHCAKYNLTYADDGTVEVFCKDSNFRKVILYCDSVKTRPAADGSSTVQCY
jgi:hypothetical protein